MRYAFRVVLASALIFAAAACGERGDLEVRTFALERMTTEEALPLLRPYVGENGTISGHGSLITARAEPEQLERIAEVLARHDGPPAQVRVSVHVLEAGDFDGASGLDFESTLRELLPYRGYRVVDEGDFRATEWSEFTRDGFGPFGIQGRVTEVRTEGPGASARIDLRVAGRIEERFGQEIRGTVNAPLGETVVVATHRSRSEGPALVVALRADLIDAPANAPAGAAGATP